MEVQKKVAIAAGDPIREREVMMETVTRGRGRGWASRRPARRSACRARPTTGDQRPKAAARPRPSPPRSACARRAQGGARACCTSRASSTWRPAQVYAQLLDEGRYLCSERTMYRILAANREVRERRDQLRHPRVQEARAAGDRARTRCGAGTSRSCSGRRSGPTSTCT